MTALEQSVVNWTRAKLLHTRALLDSGVSEHDRIVMWREQLDAEVDLVTQGMKLLVRAGKPKATAAKRVVKPRRGSRLFNKEEEPK